MIAQGIKKADKLSRMPLCDHTSLENRFKFLRATKVFNIGELQSESGLTTWITPLNLPIWTHLWDSLPCQQLSLCLPDVWTHPKSWPDRPPTVARELMFSSIVHSLAPEDERAPLLTEHIAIAAEASMRAITASVAVASNLQLVHRDVILDYLLLQQPTVSRARMAPFMGTHLMVLGSNDIYQEIMHLRDQQVMHGRLLDNFRNPAAIGTSQSRSVWIHGVPFVPRPVPWTDASSNSSSSHINVDSSRAVGEGLGVDHADRVLSMQTTPPLEDLPLPATSEVQWVGAHLAAFVPQRQSLLGNCRASCTLGDSHVGAGVTTSTDSHTHLLQHQEYTPGLANSSEQALVQRGNRASVPSRNQGFLQLSLSWCQRTQGIYVLS